MITGVTLPALAAQIKREHAEKHDYVAPTTTLNFEAFNERGTIMFKPNGDMVETEPTEHCLGQICQRSGIPKPYADRMRGEHLDLLATNINWWWQHKPEKRMLRTLLNGANNARAFLSERYRPLDNFDLAEVVLPRLADVGCEVLSSQITETRLYIQAATPKMELDLNKIRTSGIKLADVDPVQAGIVISNSEVGAGSVRIEEMLYRLSCLNGMITGHSVRRYHVGKGRSEFAELEEAAQYFTNATRQLDDRAFWAKVSDVVDSVFTLDRFTSLAQKFADTKSIQLVSPADAVKTVVERFQLSERESTGVLDHLIKGADNSLFGLVNAVTRTAEQSTNYDRAIELERMGGQIIELPQTVWGNN
jgi:hypothetical protein